jgi:hypothetical protein
LCLLGAGYRFRREKKTVPEKEFTGVRGFPELVEAVRMAVKNQALSKAMIIVVFPERIWRLSLAS